MSVSFLCVQFRNLLPSEELLLFARARWNQAQAQGEVPLTAGDATLTITQSSNKITPFEVELSVAGSSLRSICHDSNPIVAIEDAFAQLGSLRELSGLRPALRLDETAPVELHTSPSDTLLAFPPGDF